MKISSTESKKLDSIPKESASTDRINIIDTLRGIGLLGLAIIHYMHYHTSGPLLPEIQDSINGTGISNFVYKVSKFIISYKFFSIFSFVFGLSFFLQIKRKFSKSETIRRILILLAFGILHHIFWRGDILIIYAPLAIILCLMRNVKDSIILFFGIAGILNIPGSLLQFLTEETDNYTLAHHYNSMLSEGNLLDIFHYNFITSFDKLDHQIESGRIFITGGYFLLGMYVGRKNWYKLNSFDKGIIKRGMIYSGLFVIVTGGFQYVLEQKGLDFMWLVHFKNAGLTVFYISTISLAYYHDILKKVLNVLNPVGRMSLTNYIMQSVIGLFIFYDIGFGLYGKLSAIENILIALIVFTLQLGFSHVWLKYFHYGILEWIWRSAYKMKLQKFKKNEVLKYDLILEKS